MITPLMRGEKLRPTCLPRAADPSAPPPQLRAAGAVALQARSFVPLSPPHHTLFAIQPTLPCRFRQFQPGLQVAAEEAAAVARGQEHVAKRKAAEAEVEQIVESARAGPRSSSTGIGD